MSVHDLFIPGTVFYLLCDFTTPPKEKFLLLAGMNPEPLFFVINSEVNDYIQGRAELLDCQVPLKRHDHSFLPHDSWVSCEKLLHPFTVEEIERQIKYRIGRAKGSINQATREIVRRVVKDSRLLEGREKRWVLDGLKDP